GGRRHVDRREGAAGEAADAGRYVEGLLQLALQALDLGEEVAWKEREVHRPGSWRVGWRCKLGSAPGGFKAPGAVAPQRAEGVFRRRGCGSPRARLVCSRNPTQEET